MTASLPEDVQEVFDRFITTEYTTVDRAGHPITWPVTPYYRPGDPCIDVTTGLGYPKKADDAARNPKVALLFSDPTGSGLEAPPAVLVQGTAAVDDRDLEANRERYGRESAEKLPAVRDMLPPKAVRRFLQWYFTRIYVHVRPERVMVWSGGDFSTEPQLFDTHMEEVRSGHDEEAEQPPDRPAGGEPAWDRRMDELGRVYRTGVLSQVAPDGFPFSARVEVDVDRGRRRVRIASRPVGAPLRPGLCCLAAHDHEPQFRWQRNFHVRGDLVPGEGDGLEVVPHRLVGGFELPRGRVSALRQTAAGTWRHRRRAKRELERRQG
jgi:Pyridoxamine 5'-phosphate oxidase